MCIRQIIADSGLSDTEVARRAGFSVGHLGDLKSGRRPLTLKTATALERALGREDLSPKVVEAAKQKDAA